MIDDDYEIDDGECPRCRESGCIRSRACDAIHCEDGYIDEYEEDAINYAPGEEFSVCHECHGYGVLRWCSKCGLDVQAFLNLEDRE